MDKLIETIKLWEHYYGALSRIILFSDTSGAFIDEEDNEVLSFHNLDEFYNTDPASLSPSPAPRGQR